MPINDDFDLTVDMKKYLVSPDTHLTIRDQNGNFLFEGYGAAEKGPNELVVKGDFGEFLIKNTHLMTYEVVSSLGANPWPDLEVNVKAFIESLPNASLYFDTLDTNTIAPLPTYEPLPSLGAITTGIATGIDQGGFIAPQPIIINFTLSPEQTLEVLQEAKNLLIEKGWIKGQFNALSEKGESQYCTLGALAKVMMDKFDLDTWGSAIYTEPAKIIADIVRLDIAQWNDNPDRTFADVMDVFDKAILMQKEKIAEAPNDGS